MFENWYPCTMCITAFQQLFILSWLPVKYGFSQRSVVSTTRPSSLAYALAQSIYSTFHESVTCHQLCISLLACTCMQSHIDEPLVSSEQLLSYFGYCEAMFGCCWYRLDEFYFHLYVAKVLADPICQVLQVIVFRFSGFDDFYYELLS